jgi:hypothetical protein
LYRPVEDTVPEVDLSFVEFGRVGLDFLVGGNTEEEEEEEEEEE